VQHVVSVSSSKIQWSSVPRDGASKPGRRSLAHGLDGLDGLEDLDLERVGHGHGRGVDEVRGILLLLATVVPVVDEAGTLDGLRGRVGRVAGEEEVIARLDTPGCVREARRSRVRRCEAVGYTPKRMKTNLCSERAVCQKRANAGRRRARDARVGGEGAGHGAGDDFLIFPDVCEGGEREAPVCDLLKKKVREMLGYTDSEEHGRDPRSGCLEERQIFASGLGGRNALKKYSRAAGERSQFAKVEAMV
jgi:hypothetical protein